MTTALRRRLARHRPGYPYSDGRTIAIYGGLMVAILLAALDQTIVATALPSIVTNLGGLSSYSWVFSAYLLCQTVTVPIYGRLGDVYGRRRLFFVSIPLFLLGSALAGAAQNMPELIAFRGLQGLGAGGVIPLAMATTAEVVPPRDRGRYAALISAAFAGASVLGPTVGGVIVDNANWRWIFYVNIPIGAVALSVIAATMPRQARRHGRRIDYLGAALLAGATSTLLLALLWGGATYPWVSAQVLGAAAAAVVLGVLFVARTRRASDPILPLGVIGDRIVATGCIGTALSVVPQFGATAFVPLYAQGVLGASATSSGLVLMPQTLAAVTATILTGQWIARTGRYRGNALIGPVLLGTGMVLLATMGARASPVQVAAYMALLGVGSGMMMQSLMLAAQSAVPLASLGAATSVVQFSRAIGTTVGVTVFGAIVNAGLPATLRGRSTFDHRLPPGQRGALASALHPPFILGASLCALVLFVLWRGLEERPLRISVEEPSVAAIAPTVAPE